MEDLKPHGDVHASFPFVDHSEDNGILCADDPDGDEPRLYAHSS